ncbi:hypothetical protein FRB94_001169 [Tulasnella sp. JGI-2019a]|nr:hypothetical protein FRB94_001169 [Tulasnella sp. JGI-2019a]
MKPTEETRRQKRQKKKRGNPKSRDFFPLKRLPTEIVIRILEHVIQPSEWTIESLRDLALVSKYFLSLVTSTPALWAVAKYDGLHGLDLPLLALSKSGIVPLTITMGTEDIKDLEDGDAIERAGKFVAAILQQSHRWHTATFHTCYVPTILPSLAERNMSLLETLVVCQHEEMWEGDRRFSLKHAPKLRDLSVNRVLMVGSPDTLLGLRYLHISCLETSSDSICAETVLAVISSCSMLEHLRIEEVDLNPNVICPRQDPLYLPRLKTLVIAYVSSSILLPMCTHIRADQLARLHIACSTGSTSNDLLLTLARPSEKGLANLISSGELCINTANVSIVDTEDHIHVTCFDPPASDHPTTSRISVDISLAGTTLSATNTYLSLILPKAPLNLVLTRDLLSPFLTLARIPRLSTIEIRPTWSTASKTLYGLGVPHLLGPDQDYEWLCPNVERLIVSVNASASHAELIQFLHNRYGMDDRSQTPPGGFKYVPPDHPLVSPLKSFTLLDLPLASAPGIIDLIAAIIDIIVPAGHDYQMASNARGDGIDIVVGKTWDHGDGFWAVKWCFFLVVVVVVFIAGLLRSILSPPFSFALATTQKLLQVIRSALAVTWASPKPEPVWGWEGSSEEMRQYIAPASRGRRLRDRRVSQGRGYH